MKFNIHEILIQEKLTELAHEAQEACEIIKKAFTNAFSIGQTEVPCFGMNWKFDEAFTSITISIDGVITIQNIRIPISEEGFFTCFVAELEIQMNSEIDARNCHRSLNDDSEEEELLNFDLTEDEKSFSSVAHILRDFVQCCKRKLNENCEKTKCNC